MPSDVIWLSNLNFAGLKPDSRPNLGSTQESKCGLFTPVTPSIPNPLLPQPQMATGCSSFSSDRTGAHIRMAGDVFGEELAPDATIWKLYVEEAVAQDNELVNSQNRSLDLMLLFATLFSAILTAFLIEAKDMLQADPAEVSAALLLQIAQSQQRLESGTSASNSTPIETPVFMPTLTARWINGLWFTALALSLAAALVAMLAKEWLADFVATTVRPPYEYALRRQERYNGLISWGALHITALLPTLLHLSLLFFALGIILLLWERDKVVALAFLAIAGSTMLFYLFTVILGALFESCPFVTQVSKYVHQAWSTCIGSRYIVKNNLGSEKLLHHDGTADEVLQALGWLAANSRDRTVADCAYQALAAHTGTNEILTRAKATSSPTTIEPSTKPTAQPASSSENTINVKFLSDICRRFSETLTQNHREVAACEGTNIARYAAALPTLVERVEAIAQERSVAGVQTSRAIRSSNEWDPNQYDAVMLAFGTLDMAWGNDCPALSADSYAILTAAELKLAVVVAQLGAPSNNGITRLPTLPQTIGNADHMAITFSNLVGTRQNLPHARDGRALARASVLLHYHTTGQISIGASSLIYLLNSISTAADCEHLDSDLVVEFRVNVVGRSTEQCPTADKLADSNGVFRRVLAVWRSEHVPGTWTKVDLAVAEAIGSFAKGFLKQWIGRREIHGRQSRSRSSSYRGIDFELPITPQAKEDRDAFFGALEVDFSTLQPDKKTPGWILARLLIISNIILIQLDRQPEVIGMLEHILWALYQTAEAFMRFQTGLTYAAFSRHAALIRRLVELATDHLEILSLSHSKSLATSHLVSLLALSFERRTLMFYTGLPPPKLLGLLRIIAQTPNHPSEVEQLLADMVQLVWDRPKDNLRIFSDTGEGFALLVSIGRHHEYIAAAANAIQSMVLHPRAMDKDVDNDFRSTAGFLDAASFVLSQSDSDNGVSSTGSFVERIYLILKSSSMNTQMPLPKDHPVFSQLLKHYENESLGRGNLTLIDMRRLVGWDYTDLTELAQSLGMLFSIDDPR